MIARPAKQNSFPRNTPSGSRSPREPLLFLGVVRGATQGEAERMRGVKFVFAAGAAQELVDGGPHSLWIGSPDENGLRRDDQNALRALQIVPNRPASNSFWDATAALMNRSGF